MFEKTITLLQVIGVGNSVVHVGKLSPVLGFGKAHTAETSAKPMARRAPLIFEEFFSSM